jgi:Nucleotidyl transferase AbiEii toxin, Type IV TA system
MTLPDPVRLEASVRSRIERIAREHAGDDLEARHVWIVRLRRELAYRRLLARLVAADPSRWYLKGGLALQFRLDPSRSTLDIDIGLIGQYEMADAEDALRDGIALDLGDRFAFEGGRARHAADDHALTVPITAYIGAARFEQFRIDLAPHRYDVTTEAAEFTFAHLGIPKLDEHIPIPVIGLAQQIAEKTCAIFERRGNAHSSRARDLADIATIALQIDGIDGTEVAEALRRESEQRRATLAEGLPATFGLAPAQQLDWHRRWGALIRQSPIDFDQALHVSERFLGPALGGASWEHRWVAERQCWERDP